MSTVRSHAMTSFSSAEIFGNFPRKVSVSKIEIGEYLEKLQART